MLREKPEFYKEEIRCGYTVDEKTKRVWAVQLEMLDEVERICKANGLKYFADSGTLIGAIRHEGYIPWDDDADIAMLREEYEKFRAVADEMDASVCYFQDHYNAPEYLWQYGKLRRTGTSFVRAGQEHMKGKTGVFIDIVVLDDCPKSVLGMELQDLWCFFLRKILYSRVGKVNEIGMKKAIYSFLSVIPVKWIYGRVERMASRSNNSTPNRVRTLLFPNVINLKAEDIYS